MSESNYEVKNVEPVVVSNDIQVRVFTLAQSMLFPGTITARVRIIILYCRVHSPSRLEVLTTDACSPSAKDTKFCRAPRTAFRMNQPPSVSFCLSKGWVSTTGIKPMAKESARVVTRPSASQQPNDVIA
jgi:hypothetical protein